MSEYTDRLAGIASLSAESKLWGNMHGGDQQQYADAFSDAIDFLLAELRERDEHIARTVDWLEENRPIRCTYSHQSEDDAGTLLRLLTTPQEGAPQ